MSEKIERWLKKIEAAEKKYEDYHKLVEDIRGYYKNDKKKNKQNIFWASVETLKPFLYFKQPKVYVERKEKVSDPVQSTACQILEKALEWNIGQFDFDGVIKYARNDYLLSGMGLLYEKYEPTFTKIEQEVVSENGIEITQAEILDSEQVNTVYINPVDFIADSEKVGIWEDVTWVARKIHMTKKEVVEQFGEQVREFFVETDDEEDLQKNTVVYEIWDKTSRSIKYICKDYELDFLKETGDLLKLQGFFPMPKPIMATTTSDSIVPVPDYSEIKPMLDELDGITERMKKTMQAIKVSGCYDNSFSQLGNILNKDVTLVSINDFTKLKENGGIAGVIDFMPIAQYIQSLEALAQRKAELVTQIYEVTGVSDIMRGNSDPNETATAVTKKTNFGTLRNQDRQNDMQRFITDLLKIKAEIICEQFAPETLANFVKNVDPQIAMAAIELLKTDKMRGMLLGIETDSSFNQSEEAQKVNDAVTLIHTMVTNAFQVVSAQPLLLPLYRQMIETVVVTLPNARQYEPVIDEVFNKIQQQLSEPQPEQPDPEILKVQQQGQKNQQEFAIKQEQNQLKAQEIANKKQIEDAKLMLTKQEMDYQAALKQQEIIRRGETNENITTGFARGF
jgi:hypothetical protein